MFETMRMHGLGMEEATRALIVSKAFQREVISTKNSSKPTTGNLVQAIQRLVSNISLHNLLYESDSSMDVASDDEEENLTIRSDLRVNPVSKLNTSASASETQQTSQKSNTSSGLASLSGRKRKITEAAGDNQDNVVTQRAPKKAAAAKHDPPKVSGKRKAETTTNEKPSTANGTRPRADSVTEQVDAKITAILPAAGAASVGSRAKRHHRNGSLHEDEDASMISEGATVVNAPQNGSHAEQRE